MSKQPQAKGPLPRRAGAIIAALLLPGGGHFVLGMWRRGVVWVFVEAVTLYLMVLLALTVAPLIFSMSILGVLLLRIVAIVDFRRRAVDAAPPPLGRTFLGLLALATVGVVEARINRATLTEAFYVPSGSMLPNLEASEHVLVDKRGYVPRRGDVVAFQSPQSDGLDFIKRVLGLAGDKIAVGSDGTLSLNGTPLPLVAEKVECRQEDFNEATHSWHELPCKRYTETLDGKSYSVDRTADAVGQEATELVVPSGHLFLIGDNRDHSSDSRQWGPVPIANVKGRVVGVYWSQSARGVRWERIGKRVE